MHYGLMQSHGSKPRRSSLSSISFILLQSFGATSLGASMLSTNNISFDKKDMRAKPLVFISKVCSMFYYLNNELSA